MVFILSCANFQILSIITCAYTPDNILDPYLLKKYRTDAVDVDAVDAVDVDVDVDVVDDVDVVFDDLFHIMMIVENVARCSMVEFVVAYAVGSDWSYQHLDRVNNVNHENIAVSIRCQFVVMGDFLFQQHFGLVLILVVYQMDHADPDEVTIHLWQFNLK